MPRAKVRPENRKRAAQACISCRSSKKRCNGIHPCTNCVRKGVAGQCTFEDLPSPTLNGSVREVRRASEATTSDDVTTATNVPIANGPVLPAFSPTVTIGTQGSSPEASHRLHPRLLENSRGEKVFVGGSAALSFLQYIRDTVSQSLGRSEFSNYVEQNHMFEGVEINPLPVEEVPLTLDQEHDFVDLFFKVTPGFFDLFTKHQVLSMMTQHRGARSDDKSLQVAIVCTVIAIGAQCSVRNHLNLTISRSYFAEAQRRGFEGMIADPCLDMVELFLLMAFCMFGACHRNAGFMYIGVAARAAYVLGLHYVQCDPKPSIDADRQNRIRAVWKCLVTLDTVISSLLGRPSATSTQLTKLQVPKTDSRGPRSKVSEAMQAHYELACLLDQKVQALYNSEKVTAEGALACLDELNEWSARLPAEVRLAPDTPRTGKDQEQVIGGLHVSCSYYFAVMLVSRPFLILHLTNRLAKAQLSEATYAVDLGDTDMEADVQEIAEACLNAATYMVETSMDTQSHGYLPASMCIMWAWLFAAGLVLGFDMFTSDRSSREIENAFSNSRTLLKTLSSHSPLAAHYYEILTSLSDAIATRRRKARQGRRRSNRSIVERIMAFKTPESDSVGESPINATSVDSDAAAYAQPGGHATELWTQGNGLDFDFQDMMTEPFLNWDSADFLVWDPFSYEMPV